MTDLERIELLIHQAQETIGKAEALTRLKANKDFRSLFLDGYLTEYAAQMVRTRAVSAMQRPDDQALVNNQITAIGHFDQYLSYLLTSAETAKASLVSHEEERDALINEAEV